MHRMVGRCTAGAFGFLEALFHRAFSQGNIAVAPQGQIIMAKRMRMGDPPLTWDLVPETCFTWDLGTPPYLGPGMLHTMSHTIATSCYNLYNIVQHHIIMYVSSSDIMLWSRHACHISNADSLCGHTNQLIMQDNWFNSCVTPLQ